MKTNIKVSDSIYRSYVAQRKLIAETEYAETYEFMHQNRIYQATLIKRRANKYSVIHCKDNSIIWEQKPRLYLMNAQFVGDIKGQRKEYYEERLQKVDDLRALYAEMMQKEQCFSLKDLAVSGKDLMEIGYTPGKELGATLNELLELVINGELENDEQLLLERANCWLSREDDDREM